MAHADGLDGSALHESSTGSDGDSGTSSRVERVVVLCPGPSLPCFADRPEYDLRIGVNRAAGAFRCDYWVALDVHTAGITRPVGQPTVVNKTNIYQEMCRQYSYVRGLRHLSHTGLVLDGLRERTVSWGRFGATVSLVLAAHLGARRIECFGVDWDGEEDFDGFTFHKNRRTESRWKRERGIWDQVCGVLSEAGIFVCRRGF